MALAAMDTIRNIHLGDHAMAVATLKEPRSRLPKGPIRTKREALKAFDEMNRQVQLSHSAYAEYCRRTAGTYTANHHMKRFEVYSEGADAWARVLREWLAEEGQ